MEDLDTDERVEAREDLIDSDKQVYDGVDPRDDSYYTHVTDNSGDYEEVTKTWSRSSKSTVSDAGRSIPSKKGRIGV